MRWSGCCEFPRVRYRPDPRDLAASRDRSAGAVGRGGHRLPRPRRIHRRAGHATVVSGLRVLRDDLIDDGRLRRHHPVHRIRPSDQHLDHHAAADPFLVVLVGTTLQVLTERSRQAWKIQRWRSRVRNHTVVVGYGTKGKTAVAAILDDETPASDIIVVDTDRPPWTTRRTPVWSPCTATPPDPTCCGWLPPSSRPRSSSPPAATTPRCWSP